MSCLVSFMVGIIEVGASYVKPSVLSCLPFANYKVPSSFVNPKSIRIYCSNDIGIVIVLRAFYGGDMIWVNEDFFVLVLAPVYYSHHRQNIPKIVAAGANITYNNRTGAQMQRAITLSLVIQSPYIQDLFRRKIQGQFINLMSFHEVYNLLDFSKLWVCSC